MGGWPWQSRAAPAVYRLRLLPISHPYPFSHLKVRGAQCPWQSRAAPAVTRLGLPLISPSSLHPISSHITFSPSFFLTRTFHPLLFHSSDRSSARHHLWLHWSRKVYSEILFRVCCWQAGWVGCWDRNLNIGHLGSSTSSPIGYSKPILHTNTAQILHL